VGLFDGNHPFDRVEIDEGKAGDPRRLTRKEYEALLPVQRIRLAINQQVTFYKGDRKIEMKEILGVR
jgi:hypothetical protein